MRWRPLRMAIVSPTLMVFLGFAVIKLVIGVLVTAYSEVAQRIDHAEALLNRYRALSADKSQVSARLEAIEDAVAGSIVYLKGGPNDTLIGAALQDHVRNIVESAGGVLHSSQILPVEPLDAEIPERRVRLRLQIRVGMERLQEILYNLEMARPSLFIEETTIARGEAGGPSGDERTDPILGVRMEVYGLSNSQPTNLATQLDPEELRFGAPDWSRGRKAMSDGDASITK